MAHLGKFSFHVSVVEIHFFFKADPPSISPLNATPNQIRVSSLSDGVVPLTGSSGPNGWHCVNCGKVSVRRRVAGDICVCGVTTFYSSFRSDIDEVALPEFGTRSTPSRYPTE